MKRLVGLGVGVAAIIGFAAMTIAQQQAPDRATLEENVLFVVDKSGSMTDRLPAIKNAVAEIVGTLKPDHNAGLIAFDGCTADRVKYPVPLAKRTGRRISGAVNALTAEGSTALALALEKAGEVMVAKQVCPRVIIFTDNEDTCNGSVSDIRERWNRERDKYCAEIDIIAMTEDQATIDALTDLANDLGGEVHQAEYTEDIIDAINRIISRARRGDGTVRDANDVDGSGNNGGDNNNDDNDDDGTSDRDRASAGAGSGSSNSGSSGR